MDNLSVVVNLLFGLKPSNGPEYPCYWCGILTTLLDAEDFHVCNEHQQESVKIDYDEMEKKYPLAGQDERNLMFFEEQTERHIVRAERLTSDEVHLLIQRGCFFEQGYAQSILDGKQLEEICACKIAELRWIKRYR